MSKRQKKKHRHFARIIRFAQILNENKKNSKNQQKRLIIYAAYI